MTAETAETAETAVSEERREQLARNLADVQHQIGVAARAANRDPADVRLVVVTKHWPASDVAALATLGVTDVGENRVQELTSKRSSLSQLPLRWHLIGGLQTNKAKPAVLSADVIESVDRVKLVNALELAAVRVQRRVDCLVQVCLDATRTAGRSGADPAEVARISDLIAQATWLRLRGVMGVAPNGGDADSAFGTLASIGARLRQDHPRANVISAGMSSDFRAAIAAGATHVRIGTAVLGNRRYVG